MPELALTTTFSGDETIYTLGEDLAVDSPIVKKWYIVVSNTMSMEDMHASMVRAAKLLNVAHLASADYNTVQHQIWSVLSDYQVAVNDTDLAMGTFGQKCGDVLESLQEALICLADGEVEDAISAIKDCADYADKLSEQAQAIADTFSHLAENSKTAVGAAQTATALDKKRIKEADAAIKKTEADYAELRSLTYSYDTKKAEVQALYEDALSRAETAETRAFISSLVGGIWFSGGAGAVCLCRRAHTHAEYRRARQYRAHTRGGTH